MDRRRRHQLWRTNVEAYPNNVDPTGPNRIIRVTVEIAGAVLDRLARDFDDGGVWRRLRYHPDAARLVTAYDHWAIHAMVVHWVTQPGYHVWLALRQQIEDLNDDEDEGVDELEADHSDDDTTGLFAEHP